MLSRYIVQSAPLFGNIGRSYSKLNFTDLGHHPKNDLHLKAAQVPSVEVTSENYFDIFAEEIKEPIIVNCIDLGSEALTTDVIKANIQATHGKISFAYFNYENDPTVGKRLKMEGNGLAIVHRGTCLATSGEIKDEKEVHDFISRYSWMLNP